MCGVGSERSATAAASSLHVRKNQGKTFPDVHNPSQGAAINSWEPFPDIETYKEQSAAQLNDPNGIAFDSAGNLYFADSNNHRIRRVDRNGIITTVAGTGVAGFSGDGGAGTRAQLQWPFGLAMAPGDLLYIAESSCSCMTPTTPGRIRVLRLSDDIITTATG